MQEDYESLDFERLRDVAAAAQEDGRYVVDERLHEVRRLSVEEATHCLAETVAHGDLQVQSHAWRVVRVREAIEHLFIVATTEQLSRVPHGIFADLVAPDGAEDEETRLERANSHLEDSSLFLLGLVLHLADWAVDARQRPLKHLLHEVQNGGRCKSDQ